MRSQLFNADRIMGIPSISGSNLNISSTPATIDHQYNDECPDDDPYCDEYRPYAERPETYIIPVIFSIIFIVGVIGNGTLVYVFLKHRALRSVPNT